MLAASPVDDLCRVAKLVSLSVIKDQTVWLLRYISWRLDIQFIVYIFMRFFFLLLMLEDKLLLCQGQTCVFGNSNTISSSTNLVQGQDNISLHYDTKHYTGCYHEGLL